jgi:alpha-galactosidase
MRDAILAVQNIRKIHFNLCNWGRDNVWTWGAQYGHSWRLVLPNRPVFTAQVTYPTPG